MGEVVYLIDKVIYLEHINNLYGNCDTIGELLQKKVNIVDDDINMKYGLRKKLSILSYLKKRDIDENVDLNEYVICKLNKNIGEIKIKSNKEKRKEKIKLEDGIKIGMSMVDDLYKEYENINVKEQLFLDNERIEKEVHLKYLDIVKFAYEENEKSALSISNEKDIDDILDDEYKKFRISSKSNIGFINNIQTIIDDCRMNNLYEKLMDRLEENVQVQSTNDLEEIEIV